MSDQDPKYSFVLPAYKSQFLEEAISSILAQSYTDFELIIVDDASPEDIKRVVDSFDDSRIRYYRNKQNIGGKNLVAQWNHSIEYAKGEWIILATDDDWYCPIFLKKADDSLISNPEVDLFRGRICYCNQDLKIVYTEQNLPYNCSQIEYIYHLLYEPHGGIPQYVFRKSALLMSGFYSLPMAWGSDCLTSILMAKNRVICSSEILVKFRNSGLNISSNATNIKEKIEANFEYYTYLYAKINELIPENEIEDYFYSRILAYYPYEAKKLLIKNSSMLSTLYLLSEWKWLYHLINNSTPYLNKFNKMSMFVKIIFKIY